MRLGTTFGINVPGTIRKRTLVNGRTGERFMEDMVPEASLEEGTGTGHKANAGKGVPGEEQHENDPVTTLVGQERPGEGPRRGQVRVVVNGLRGWASPGRQADMAARMPPGEWHGEDSISG